MSKFCITIFLFFLCLFRSEAQNIQITCEAPEMVFNDHVGNEWQFLIDVNGSPQSIYSPITIPIDKVGQSSFAVFESNEKFPDSASTPLGIDPSTMEPNKEYSKEVDVIIKESNGRYAGNLAKWRLKFHYKKIVSRT